MRKKSEGEKKWERVKKSINEREQCEKFGSKNVCPKKRKRKEKEVEETVVSY